MKAYKKPNDPKLRSGTPAKSGDTQAELRRLREEIARLLETDPRGAEKAAKILSAWINQNSLPTSQVRASTKKKIA